MLRQYRHYKSKVNEESQFEVVVSDLTYVKVKSSWNYICTIIDLYHREIVGFYTIEILHTDRGSEFKNQAIDEIIPTFGIKRSFSKKGRPYDNAVAESTYNIIKTEFVYGEIFSSLSELEVKFFDYANWYNNQRVQGTLGYLSPREYKL